MSDKSILEEINEVENPEVVQAPTEESPGESPGGRGIGIDLGFLKTKTGENSIDYYIEHPLNFSQSKGLAQMIRGFTGLFGALDLAVIDIVLGFMQIAKEKKVVAPSVN